MSSPRISANIRGVVEGSQVIRGDKYKTIREKGIIRGTQITGSPRLSADGHGSCHFHVSASKGLNEI